MATTLKSEDRALVEELQTQHGRVHVLLVKGELVVVRAASYEEYGDMVDGKAGGKLRVSFLEKRLARLTTVHPTVERFDAMCADQPPLVSKVAECAMTLAGANLSEAMESELSKEQLDNLYQIRKEHPEVAVFLVGDQMVVTGWAKQKDRDRAYETQIAGNLLQSQRELSIACVLHPSRDDMIDILREWPGLGASVVDASERLSSSKIEDLGKA